jgi:antirestriction protein ArdC
MTTVDLYSHITDRLIALIEANPGDPQLPWRRSGLPLALPVNAVTRKAYQGINIVSLWMTAAHRAYDASYWATFRQWQSAGAQVRKGEKAALVIFYKAYDVEPDPDARDDDGKRRVARASHVFNLAQVDGFAALPPPPASDPVTRLLRADQFIAHTKARIRFGGERATYRPATDEIVLPPESLFIDTSTMTRSEAFYATLLHECIHYAAFRIMPRRSSILWTGAQRQRGMSA